MNAIAAIRAVSPIKNGVTKPYYVTCKHNETYAVKFAQNPEGARVLLNEFVCAKIAQELELPLPEPALIVASDEFISDHGNAIADHIGAPPEKGLHYGTVKIKKVFPIPSARIIDEARNKAVVPEILIFDQFISNSDRDRNGGNLLFDATNKLVVLIDHTHAFELGPIWDAAQLRQRIGQPFQLFDSTGYVYKKLIPHIDGNNPFHTILGKMSRMTDETLWHIINGVPDEWGMSPEEKEILHLYLLDRKNRIEEVLPLMRTILPRWKGGS
jgi:hypothetical protein